MSGIAVTIPSREALTPAMSRDKVVQIRRREIERRLRLLAVQSPSYAVGLEQLNLLSYGAAAEASGATNPCDGSLVHLVPGQQQSPVSMPADTVGLQRHDHLRVDQAGVSTSKPMSTVKLTPEQAAAKIALLKMDDVEAALGEVERELQVRERCYPRWVEEGKMSRIDAKDRMSRQIQARELLLLLLTSSSDYV
jgi:hypothetical protein